jgi:hypothetical protein
MSCAMCPRAFGGEFASLAAISSNFSSLSTQYFGLVPFCPQRTVSKLICELIKENGHDIWYVECKKSV